MGPCAWIAVGLRTRSGATETCPALANLPLSNPRFPNLQPLYFLGASFPPSAIISPGGPWSCSASDPGPQPAAQVELVKRIPAAAGLGGGSSDAAAALIAGNLGWQLNWPSARLAELAAELGSDVPFFLESGAAICRGRGEQIEPGSGGSEPALHRDSSRPPDFPRPKSIRAAAVASFRGTRSTVVQALRRGDLRTAARHFGNRLEPAAEQLSPWPGRLRAEFARLDCVVAQMSGSGSSYFGLCRHARQARRLARRLAARRLGRVFALRS